MLSILRRGLIRTQLVRWVSNASTKESSSASSFTLAYLVNSCGLSPESAASVSKRVTLRTPAKPDAVVQFLKTRGFAQTQVVDLIRKFPQLLQCDPLKTLKPKLDFFEGIGVSRPDMTVMVTMHPRVLRIDHKRTLICAIEFLRTILLTEKELLHVVRMHPELLERWNLTRLSSNIQVLLSHGVPMLNASKMILRMPRMLLSDPSRFAEVVEAVKEMGIDPLASTFLLAIMAKNVKSKWDHNFQVFKSLGLSDAQIMSAFKLQPWIFVMSEKKIRKMMEFIVGRMGFAPSVISSCPNLLLFSLERRIMPRYNVLKLLMKLGIIKNDWKLYSVLQMKEKGFLEKFVVRYQGEIPELLKVYQAKGDQ